MTDNWNAVDEFIVSALHEEDPVLQAAVDASLGAGLPDIRVSTTQAKMLHILARSIGAGRILEIGTLGGFSGIWLARALPTGGRLVTIEVNPAHASVAQANFTAAGVDDLIDLRVGPALDVLPIVAQDGLGPFDLTFIDADKPNNRAYMEWAVRLSRPGSMIVLDNVVRGGAVADPAEASGARAAIEWIGAVPELEATVLQTVGAKGYDGFAIALVK